MPYRIYKSFKFDTKSQFNRKHIYGGIFILIVIYLLSFYDYTSDYDTIRNFIQLDNVDLRNKFKGEQITFINFHEKEDFLNSVHSNGDILKFPVECDDITLKTQTETHGKFLILQNFIKSRRYFKCDESITYAAPSDHTFLDNIIPVVKRWETPLSIAVYAPGSDFNSTLKVIFHLRNCIEEKEMVKDFVTFHIFFEKEFFYDQMTESYEEAEKILKCSENFLKIVSLSKDTFRYKNNLTFPINVARNIARNSSMTHLVLYSDIELYPSVNFIQSFFHMLTKNSSIVDFNKDVLVFPVFEVIADQEPPKTKSELLTLFNAKKVFWFQENVCRHCHAVPFADRWLQDNSNEMTIASRNKRTGAFHAWEPFYVGTKDLPFFDERLDWDGGMDKMVKIFLMCLLDYNFNVLSNAFLVHRPGIKKPEDAIRPSLRTTKILAEEIIPEYNNKYGMRDSCSMY